MENPLYMVVLMGKSSINGPFSMAMLNYQRVYSCSWTWVTVTANFETKNLTSHLFMFLHFSSMRVSCSQPLSACEHITNEGRKNQPPFTPIIPIHPRHCFPIESGDLPYPILGTYRVLVFVFFRKLALGLIASICRKECGRRPIAK